MTTTGFCQKCGTGRVAGAQFCGSCGTRFDAQPISTVGWGLENPAGFRPMVVNPLVLWFLVLAGAGVGLMFAVWVLGYMLSGLALLAALVICPIIGAFLGSWLAAKALR